MSMRERVTTEIEKHSDPKDKPLLLWFLSCCETEQQWTAFTTVRWIKTGTMSYQAKRQWVPKEALLKIGESVEL